LFWLYEGARAGEALPHEDDGRTSLQTLKETPKPRRPKVKEVAKVRIHVTLCYSVIPVIAITAYKAGKLEQVHNKNLKFKWNYSHHARRLEYFRYSLF